MEAAIIDRIKPLRVDTFLINDLIVVERLDFIIPHMHNI